MKQATAALRPAAGANSRHSHGSHSHIRSQVWLSCLKCRVMVGVTLEAFEVAWQTRNMCTQVDGNMRDVAVQADVAEIKTELAQREEQLICELLRDVERCRRSENVLEPDRDLGVYHF